MRWLVEHATSIATPALIISLGAERRSMWRLKSIPVRARSRGGYRADPAATPEIRREITAVRERLASSPADSGTTGVVTGVGWGMALFGLGALSA